MNTELYTQYDTLSSPPHRSAGRPPEFYLERWRRRHGMSVTGGGRMEKFRRISKHLGVTVEDVIEDRLPKVVESEFHYHQWHAGIVHCAYCGVRLSRQDLTRDHVIPKAQGGADLGLDNLVPACRSCNGAKGCRSLLSFLADRT